MARARRARQHAYRDLCALRLTSRAWSKLATPILFSHLAFKTNQSYLADSFRINSLPAYSHLVKTLQLVPERFEDWRAIKHDLVSFSRLPPLLLSLHGLVFQFPNALAKGFDDCGRIFFTSRLSDSVATDSRGTVIGMLFFGQLSALEAITFKRDLRLRHLRSGEELLVTILEASSSRPWTPLNDFLCFKIWPLSLSKSSTETQSPHNMSLRTLQDLLCGDT